MIRSGFVIGLHEFQMDASFCRFDGAGHTGFDRPGRFGHEPWGWNGGAGLADFLRI
jgi:hypothetical protein